LEKKSLMPRILRMMILAKVEKQKKGQEIQSCRDSPFKAIRPHLGLGFRVFSHFRGLSLLSTRRLSRARRSFVDSFWTPPAAAGGSALSALSASASSRI
jgi:hypothetical protein